MSKKNTIKNRWILIIITLFIFNTNACKSKSKEIAILSINDVYRINGLYDGEVGGLARVRSLRIELEKKYPELIVLHAGDFLFPSIESNLDNGKKIVATMNLLDGAKNKIDDRFFVTFGNHEFEKSKLKDAPMLQGNIDSSEFQWMASNITFAKGKNNKLLIDSEKIIQSKIIEVKGVKVGIFSITTEKKHPAYVASFTKPVKIARRMSAKLRAEGAQVVVALTHLKASRDKNVLEKLGADGPDIIIGGHEHDKQSHNVNGRYVVKADADAKTAILTKIDVKENGSHSVSFDFIELDEKAPADEFVQKNVDELLKEFDAEYCKKRKMPVGCSFETFSFAKKTLVAEELEIRRYETNMGNWVTDQALMGFKKQPYKDIKVQVAVMNGGSMRLNQNIKTGSKITRAHIDELLPYPTNLVLIKVTGALLQKILNHSIEDWTGNGWWLQVSGLAYRHNPETNTADQLTLLTPEGPRAIKPTDEIIVATTDYITTPSTGQDGFTMIKPEHVLPADGKSRNLQDLVREALLKNREAGIAPELEGRICNTTRKGKCLAIGG